MQGKNSTETTVTILSDFPVRSEILVENFMTELILCRFHYAGINPIWAGGQLQHHQRLIVARLPELTHRF